MELLGEVNCDHIAGDPPVKYTVSGCPKCLGKGVYGDIEFNLEGKVKTISGISQLKQQLKKIIIENTRETGYGFNYSAITFSSGDAQLINIKKELNRCLEYLSFLQVTARGDGFFYSNTELLDSVERIEVIRDADVRKVNATIYCKTVSGRDIIINVPLER